MDEKTDLIYRNIKNQYKSIRAFANETGIPYTTIKSALSKGIGGTSIETVLKMCDFLNIDISELQNNPETPPTREQILIEKYNQADGSIKVAVDKLLDMPE